MEIQEKIRQYLGEDATDQEKHDKLNDIFQSLERRSRYLVFQKRYFKNPIYLI